MPNSPQLWQKEYKEKGIPSSFKTKHSGSLVLLVDWLNKNNISLRSSVALDLGSGTGRNSLFLINAGINHVYSLDFVPDLIESLRSRILKQAISDRLTALCHDLTKPWPIKTNSIDLILDIFCFKHQSTQKNQSFYKKEIVRVLKKGGIMLISLAGVNDEYYGSLPKTFIKKGVYKITDPKTRVDSYLYTKESLIREFKDYFKLENFKKDKKAGLMHRKRYLRSTLQFIFNKND